MTDLSLGKLEQTAKQSFEASKIIAPPANTFTDGMAVRSPIEEAFHIYSKGASRIVSVSESEIAHAIRMYFACTHNVAKEKNSIKGKKVGLILTGGNIDTDKFAMILEGNIPVI